jgi:16S rRNA processing protein RimM
VGDTPTQDEPVDLVIGRISGVYGVKGWVRIRSFTEPAENLLGYRDLKIRRRDQWETIEIDGGRQQGKGLIAHLAGVDDRDSAELLNGCEIAITRDQLPSLVDGEYYWHQLEGLRVETAGKCLGQVDHLLETGANDVLVVKPCEGSVDSRERLIPWVLGLYVKSVDLDRGVIQVDWDPEF